MSGRTRGIQNAARELIATASRQGFIMKSESGLGGKKHKCFAEGRNPRYFRSGHFTKGWSSTRDMHEKEEREGADRRESGKRNWRERDVPMPKEKTQIHQW
ncbi:hypothetical protein NDU88_002094 [Pleurodeles waltl]|uniref:Uncharacterized protein n=1 Tax=Pleurodeles waltl TaxID=8319 RepID=A0AAV7P7S7_PLEWA|nr:hypothetical protein NDU88_002094 [Pleurodeles waltl]